MDAIQTTIDAAGRFVVPNAIRGGAGIGPGDTLTVVYRDGRIEVEAVPQRVRIEQREGLHIAEPDGFGKRWERTVRVRVPVHEGMTALDSSIILAGLLGWHEAHHRALRALVEARATTLLTLDRRDFSRLDPGEIRIVVPA